MRLLWGIREDMWWGLKINFFILWFGGNVDCLMKQLFALFHQQFSKHVLPSTITVVGPVAGWGCCRRRLRGLFCGLMFYKIEGPRFLKGFGAE